MPTGLASKRTCLREGAIELLRDRKQPSITRPASCPSDRCGGQQVNIDVSDALAIELVLLDIAERFCNIGPVLAALVKIVGKALVSVFSAL